MSTPITEFVTVTVSIADRLLRRAGFGTLLIFGLFSAPSAWATGQRTASYASLAEVAVDFATTTKVYKAASAVFTGERAPTSIKVGRADSGDADIAASLDAIEAYDPEWYGLVSTYRTEANLNSIAAKIETMGHIALLCSEDSGVLVAATDTDIASDLQAAGYNRTAYLWHHEGGVDVTDGDLAGDADGGAEGTGIATITKTGHTLRVGDSVTVSGAAKTQANGNKTVLTVPTADTFTVAAVGIADGADANNGAIAYFARYAFPEARWMGHMLPTTPGEETWAFQPLTGQTPAPTSLLNLTAQRAAKAKNANIYTAVNGVGVTSNGVMASGRFIDNQIGVDWMRVRQLEAVMQQFISAKKVPFTEGGIAAVRSRIASVNEEGIRNALLDTVLLDGSGNPDPAGRAYIIDTPALSEISAEDRAARLLGSITNTVRFAGAIHNVTIATNVTL